MPDRLPVIVKPLPFKSATTMLAVEGTSIREIVNQMYEQSGIPPVWRDMDLMVEMNGVPVPRDEWAMVPRVSDHVLMYVPVHGGGTSGGGGGKDTTRTILSLVVVVVATIVTFWGGGWGGAAVGSALGLTTAQGSAIMGMAIMTAGMLLINALCPIRSASQDQSDEASSQSYSITGARNQMNPFGVIPVVLGTHKMFPCIATQPWIELAGDDEYLRMAFVWGYGRLSIGTIYIGDTPLSSYAGVTSYTYEGLAADAALQLIPNTSQTVGIGVELPYNVWCIRAAPVNVDYINAEVSWPGGIGANLGEDGLTGWTSWVAIYYREVGGGWGYVGAVGATNIYTTKTMRRALGVSVNRAKSYEIGFVKTIADGDNQTTWNTAAAISITGHIYEDPITFPYPLAVTEVRIKASQQLNGMIDTLNAVVSSYAPTWTGAAWTVAESVTNNPAALFRKVLMHNANARPRTSTQIDDAGLGAWYTFCATKGYTFNQVRDFRASVWETLADIASAGRASPSLTDGLWGVTVDSGTESVVQHITPRNSWGFSAEKVLYNRPHAFRCAFNNEDEGYAKDEIIVYDDGYTVANATVFESLEFPGLTDPDLVWKFARYHMAQARLRPEKYTVNMDFEHLVCRRGSKVRVSHDVPLWGSGWGRVKTVTTVGGNTTAVTLDDYVVMEAGKSYVCRFRRNDSANTSLLISVNTVVGETNSLTFTTPVVTGVSTSPYADDLAMFGEAAQETVLCLVQSIERSGDFVAKLTLVDESPTIYTADAGAIPAFDTHITRPVDVSNLVPEPPSITDIRSGVECLELLNGAVKSRIFVSLHAPLMNLKMDYFRVRYVDAAGGSYNFVDVPPEDGTAILTDVIDGFIYSIQAQSVSIYGVASAWTEAVNHTVIGQSAVPADVTGFSCNVIAANAYLSWSPVADVDLSHYRIRWSPALSGATWADAVDVVERVARPATTVTVPAMVGTYLIKAVDYAGNMSASAAVATTSISTVAGMNYVTQMAAPPWDGTGDDVYYIPDLGGLALAAEGDLYDAALTDLYSVLDLYLYGGMQVTGTWTFDDDIIDLGGVFTSRITASITGTGQDLLADLYLYTDLYDAANLYGVTEGSYSSVLEIRTTEDDPAGVPTWTDWQTFLVGDYKARGIEFRVTLTGTPPGVTPIVMAVSGTVDMPDRVIGFNAAVGVGGATITFSPAFYVTPYVGIAITDGQEGDAYTITNKTAAGFDIAFTKGGVAVARNITGLAKAYGELA